VGTQHLMRRPGLDGLGIDRQRVRNFIEGQHTQVAEPIIARLEPVVLLDASDVSSCEALAFAGTQPALIEDRCGRTIGMVMEQPVDLGDHLRARHPVFPSAERVG